MVIEREGLVCILKLALLIAFLWAQIVDLIVLIELFIKESLNFFHIVSVCRLEALSWVAHRYNVRQDET